MLLIKVNHIVCWARCTCFLVVCFLSLTLLSQQQKSLTEYTTENGLSLNSVNDLLFDREGFLWIATADGLQRFDGYRFQNFRQDPLDKKSVPENAASEIYEDWNGNLWITHRTHITIKPKGKTEFIDLTSTMPPYAFKYPLSCVGENDSSVWVINYPAGIYAVNKTTLKANKLFSFPEFEAGNAISMLSRFRSKDESTWFRNRNDKTGDLYSISGEGIRRFRNTGKINVLFVIQENLDSVVLITDKMIYKASARDPFTVSRILPSSVNTSDLDNINMTWPRKIGKNKYLLIGTKKIFLYDGVQQQINLFPYTEYFSRDLIRYLQVSATDKYGNIWLGYNGIGGIKVISPQKFGLFKRPDKNALPYSITSDRNGKTYVGIYLGDIEVYDHEGRFIKKIQLPEADKKSGSPRGMVMIDSVTMIVKSVIDRLYAINIRDGKAQLLSYLLPAAISDAPGDFEFGMQKIKNGEIWFSFRKQILSLTKNRGNYSVKNICTLPGKERINSFFCNEKGQLWIGDIAGAWYFENNSFQKIPIPVSYIKHINQHPDGKIWITTSEGIYILKDNRVYRWLSTKDGLPNSFVYGVLFDDTGNGWVSTNRGLAKIDSAYRITTYSAKEGLQGDEFNTKGFCKGADGTLFFAGVNGINFFKPQNLVGKGEPSETKLTGIEVNNQSYHPDQQPEFIHTINLPHDKNNIRLSFSYMDFTVPERNQYKFWLKGFQNDWTLPQTNNTVQYILPPREYQLYVLGANYEGVWSKEPLVLNINILPPWYQTIWAKIIFLLLASGIVGAIFYFISKNRYQKKLRKLQMEQEVQKEKQRLSRDLHDNLGSQITWLSNNINQLETAQQQEQPVKQKLNRLKEGAGGLMNTLRETIWVLNKDRISCVDLFDKVVSHAVRYIEPYPSMQLQTEEKISSTIQLGSSQALQLFRICQEAITNSCKHAEATLLSIKANADKKHFSIVISDDGKGFDLNNENPGHYGLQNMKQRAEESNLQLKIESTPDKGTAITVSVQE